MWILPVPFFSSQPSSIFGFFSFTAALVAAAAAAPFLSFVLLVDLKAEEKLKEAPVEELLLPCGGGK